MVSSESIYQYAIEKYDSTHKVFNSNQTMTRSGDAFILPGGKSQLSKDGGGINIKHCNDEGILVTPTPGFVLKTKAKDGGKVFLNICYHDEVEPPGQKKKLDDNGNEIEGLNIPLSMSPIRTCHNKENYLCFVADVILHSSVKQDIERDQTGSQRDFICGIVIQCFDQKYSLYAPLDRKYKLPRLIYFGYIDSRTGEAVRKKQNDEHIEVYKQYIRKSKNLIIEEIVSSSASTVTDVTCTPGPISCTKNEKLKEEAEYDIVIETTFENEIKLDKFIDDVNHYFLHSNNYKDLPFILPPPCEKTKSLTLLLNSKVTDKHEVLNVVVRFSLPLFDLTTTLVESSAYTFYVKTLHHQSAQVVLPFCIDPSSTIAIYDKEVAILTIKAAVLQTKMEDKPDIGSRQWILTRGLLSSKPIKQDPSLGGRRNGENVNQRNYTEFQDPYHTRPLYVNDADFVTKGKKPDNEQDTEASLPEDRFHAKDALSQHSMEQQEKERKEKIQMKEKERKDRVADKNVEYINTEDFKPGGKYYISESRSTTVDDTNDVCCNKAIITLKKAEEVLQKNYKSAFTTELWTQLF